VVGHEIILAGYWARFEPAESAGSVSRNFVRRKKTNQQRQSRPQAGNRAVIIKKGQSVT